MRLEVPMLRARSSEARGEVMRGEVTRWGGGDRAREVSGMSWYGAKFAAMISACGAQKDDRPWWCQRTRAVDRADTGEGAAGMVTRLGPGQARQCRDEGLSATCT